MKASELIEKLAQHIQQNGDCSVHVSANIKHNHRKGTLVEAVVAEVAFYNNGARETFPTEPAITLHTLGFQEV